MNKIVMLALCCWLTLINCNQKKAELNFKYTVETNEDIALIYLSLWKDLSYDAECIEERVKQTNLCYATFTNIGLSSSIPMQNQAFHSSFLGYDWEHLPAKRMKYYLSNNEITIIDSIQTARQLNVYKNEELQYQIKLRFQLFKVEHNLKKAWILAKTDIDEFFTDKNCGFNHATYKYSFDVGIKDTSLSSSMQITIPIKVNDENGKMVMQGSIPLSYWHFTANSNGEALVGDVNLSYLSHYFVNKESLKNNRYTFKYTEIK